MTFNPKRILLKKINIKLNIFSLILILIALLSVHSLISNSCDKSEDILINKIKYRLIVIILTSPDNMKNRDVIRKTWISEKNENIKHLFAIGTLDIQSEQIETLKSEQQKYNDLLLLPKLEDLYNTLTKKLMINLDSWDSKKTGKELYWGFFNGKAQVKRTGPWKEPDWNICDYYLPYALGGGYVLSYNLVKFIALNANLLRLFNAEDVSVGLWLAPIANVEKKHDVRFDTEYRSRGCSNQYIITHKQEPENMRKIHDFYMSTGTLCATEIKIRMSYQYNWTVPPSQCCNRQTGII
ncbi:hypothetical protein PV328_000522 [Microctonus aethiopoides]|uniref:Hexosyltransferase n=1 Tax=Microctonus aethiopoides TaxID=144406 RepID=A0AA39KWD6_9HYME|nr:hypothetical protein PV328_000522 [Microctonus aethiopoides]